MAVVVLDASVVIAFLDANDTHHRSAVSALSKAVAGDAVLPASTYAEVLVEPWRRGVDAVAHVRKFVAEFGIRIEPLTGEMAERAARLRARHRSLRLPDALVLATSDVLDAHVFTCDRTWPRVSRRAQVI
jgi:PIN domain nuclease of toxin-antitoxin system